jgi:hypothetical protein
MCVGEKRKLKIPAKMGYGERGSPPKIPGMADHLFVCLLVPCEEIVCVDSFIFSVAILHHLRCAFYSFSC